MAYNDKTRLLLNFEGGSVVDTSSFSRTVHQFYDPVSLAAGAGRFGGQAAQFNGSGLSMASAYDLLANATQSCVADFWVRPVTVPTELYGIATFQQSYNETTSAGSFVQTRLSGYGGIVGLDFYMGDENSNVNFTNVVVAVDTWHHVRIRVTQSGVKIGVNGAEVFSWSNTMFTTTNSGSLDVGAAFGTSRVDCVQVLQGDDTWTGGNYTVPTAAPDDFVHQTSRLLLKFNNTTGATTSPDTSAYARTAVLTGTAAAISGTVGVFGTKSALLGDPFGAGSIGTVTLNSHHALFGNSAATTKRVDFWYRHEAYPPSGEGVLFTILWSNNDQIYVSYNASQLTFTYQRSGNYLTQTVNITHTAGQFKHFRMLISGNTVKVGIAGSEVISLSDTGDLWTGSLSNPITSFRVGGYPDFWGSDLDYFFRGYIDAIEFRDGDTSWTGGTYTVPTAEPNDFGVSGSLTATGANTTENVTGSGQVGYPSLAASGTNTTDGVSSTGDALTERLPVGANTTDAVTSTGAGELGRVAVGANTLDAVTSKSPPAQLPYNANARLLLNFNEDPIWDSGFGMHYVNDKSGSFKKAYFETPTALALSGTIGKFDTPSLKFGAPEIPGTTFPVGRLVVTDSASIFSNSSSSPKQFDFWFRREADTVLDVSSFFYISFQNGDWVYFWRNSSQIGVTIKQNGTQYGYTGNYSNFAVYVWHHVRIRFSGQNVIIAAGGDQRASYTVPLPNAWPGSPSNPVNDVVFGDFPPLVGSSDYGWRGYLDDIQWLENDYSYTGGAYTVPTRPWGEYDPYAVGTALASGGNTTNAVTSTGTVGVLDNLAAAGENTVQDAVSSASATISYTAFGQNTVEDTASLGRVEYGIWWTATGANTTANVTSTGTGTVPPIRYAEGQRALDEVTSTGSSLVSDRIATGQNTLDTLTTVADGTTAGVVSGQNTVTTTSSGTATVLASATGANTLDDATSSAASLVAFNAVSQVLTEVFSVGTATVLVSAVGENTVSVTSTGTGKFEIFGQGDVLLDDVTTQATTAVLCAGSGGNALDDVRTYFPAGYFDAFIYEVVMQQRNEHWVRQ